MSKTSKFLRSPVSFFKDAINKRIDGSSVKTAPIAKAASVKKAPTIAPAKNPALKSSTSLSAAGSKAVKKAASAKIQQVKAAAITKPAVTAVTTDTAIPDWFNARPGSDLSRALATDKPIFLYVPWIAEHGDALLSKISSDKYTFAPLDFIRDLDLPDRRRSVLRFARENPDLYRKMIARRLVPIRDKVKAVIFTFDWAPIMRIISMVCNDLEIPCILIPHESVFVDRNKYYWDPKSYASVPNADLILSWGGLQKEIFAERGYPDHRIIPVGAPKFDIYHDYQPHLSREQYSTLFGIDAHKKIMLFATQPLDSQMNARVAREAQRNAIRDLATVAKNIDAQMIVRLPPSKDNILGDELIDYLLRNTPTVIDDANCYLVPPEEAIYHSDLVCSINSTMLFEGILAGRPALSLKYTDFDQIWRHAGVPSVTSMKELEKAVPEMIAGGWKIAPEGMEWAAQQFSCGVFDGKAKTRIAKILEDVALGQMPIDLMGTALKRVFSGEKIDTVGHVSYAAVRDNAQKYLKDILGAKTMVPTNQKIDNPIALATIDVFMEWGISETAHKKSQREKAYKLGRPTLIVEDGFLCSLDIGLSGTPALSMIIDDKTAYYDATSVSRLAYRLENGAELKQSERERAKAAISSIRHHRLSKYNHAPDIPLEIGNRDKKLLLIDQRFGDQSVASGLADEKSFDRMIADVMRDRKDWDIIVKLHPDALKGGKQSYLTPSRFPFAKFRNNIHFVDFDVNPHALFDLVDEVYVATSGMGFEALMAGKKVHCYGMPFYAGWGETVDQLTLPTRTRKRDVEEIFYHAYIEASRYYSPDLERACEIEELIDYLAKHTRFAQAGKPHLVVV